MRKCRKIRSAWWTTLFCFAPGCYHFAFEQDARTAQQPPPARVVRYEERRPTYLNGFVGTGRVDTTRFCADPVRTELKVTAVDVLLSVVTLLIYTPHTLYVTCPAAREGPSYGDVARAPLDR